MLKLTDPRLLRDMGDGGSTTDDDSSEGSSTVYVDEQGNRNKRKLSSVESLEIPPAVQNALHLTEFSHYDNLEEKLRNAWANLKKMGRPESTSEEQDMVEECKLADWDDPIACQLQEILIKNMSVTFSSAIKSVVECGYPEEIATWAVLNVGLPLGSKDALSNAVDGALAFLNKDRDIITPKDTSFGGLQRLVDYTILEMINVLRELRPGSTLAEAMWRLLISDLNLINACGVEESPPGDSSALSESKSEISGASQNADNLQNSEKLMPPQISGPAAQMQKSKSVSGELTGTGNELCQEVVGKISSKAASVEKSGGPKKGSVSISKRDFYRQRACHHLEKSKSRITKVPLRATKVSAWGSMVVDRALNSPTGSSSELMKGTHPNSATSAGVNVSFGDLVAALPAPVHKVSPAPSPPDPNPVPKEKPDVSSPPPKVIIDYKSVIPYDETLKKCIPQDEKDEGILALVVHKEALEKELAGWTDWANEKVMRATRRLAKDRAELKMLKQEKDEVEKLVKERTVLEENTFKRLTEMEYALSNASGQIELASITLRRLEELNLLLKKEMAAIELESICSATRLQEAVTREEAALRKSQLLEKGKGLLVEKLKDLNCQKAELESRKEKVEERVDQFKVLLKHEEKEKAKVAALIDTFRVKREEEEALLKKESDDIKQVAETELKDCKKNIENLRKTISDLKLESVKSKIAELSIGYGSSGGSSSSSSVERECIMCMAEEIAVVFLPCAHQILCGDCSVRHEKQGMKDCPSCRAVIEKRISVGYPPAK